jgi:hypothetical protein
MLYTNTVFITRDLNCKLENFYYSHFLQLPENQMINYYKLSILVINFTTSFDISKFSNPSMDLK